MNYKILSKANIDEFGHTNECHVIVTDKNMVDRLIHGDLFDFRVTGRTKEVASKFLSEEIAVKAIKRTLEKKRVEVEHWMNDRTTPTMCVSCTFKDQIGYGFVKGTSFNKKYPMYECTIVLKLGYNGAEFEVKTAYPEPSYKIKGTIEEDKRMFASKRRRS